MELPNAVSLAPQEAHSSPGMGGLAYVASIGEGEGDNKAASFSLLTCGADGALSSRPICDASADDAPLADATSISTGASLSALTCLAASCGVFAVGDESNYVRVRLEREKGRKRD